MRVAILHHWFLTRGGGERVAECLASLFPQADLYAMFCSESAIFGSIKDRSIHTSVLQKIPGSIRAHTYFLPLYPAAARSIDLRAYDLVISSDAGLAKGARIRKDAVHICYCHSPMRLLYDGYRQQCRAMKQPGRKLFTMIAPRVRRFDLAAASRVDVFLANSYYVADRIQRLYGREATVVYPPVDVRLARQNEPGDHYLCAGSLVNYKRTEIMIEACERLGRKLRIAGTGPEEARLRKLAGPYTTFLGHLSDEELWDEYSRCRALLFAADEDFGLVPLEVQACGRPVLAFGFGGSLETVLAEDPQILYASRDQQAEDEIKRAPTGLYFSPQTAESLAIAILRFEQEPGRFRPGNAVAHAGKFSTETFLRHMADVIRRAAPAALPQMAWVDGVAPGQP